jgi:hypothetical protein
MDLGDADEQEGRKWKREKLPHSHSSFLLFLFPSRIAANVKTVKQLGWVWWCTPVSPTTQEVEERGL